MHSGIHRCVQELAKVARTWYSMVQEETRFIKNGKKRKAAPQVRTPYSNMDDASVKYTRAAWSRTPNIQCEYRMSVNED